MSDLTVPRPERMRTSTRDEAACDQPATGFERVLGTLRLAIPLVQRLLPLLDGNIGTAVSNLVSPQPKASPPPPPVNLGPIEDTLSGIQAGQRDLRAQVTQQNDSLNRVESRLAQVGGAVEGYSVAQQQMAAELQTVGHLVEDLQAAGRRSIYFRVIALLLLMASIAANVLLFVYLRRNLP